MDISSATARVAPDLLKALEILSDTTFRRFAVNSEDLKPYWKSEKKPNFSWGSTILLTIQEYISPTFLSIEITDEIFKQSGNQDSFRHILKSSASMYKISGSLFFRTTTGIQLGRDSFDESIFAITFLTILGVTEILCSFRLVLKKKTGKEIPKSSSLQSIEKFLANNSALSDAEDNNSGPLNRISIADLPLLRTLLAIRSDELFSFSSICNFGSFKTPFTIITSLFEFYFR